MNLADEYIDILNDDLTVLKSCLKSEAHKHGYLHASIHVWFYTDSGELLLQKRSPNKISFPNLWDVSVAGHVSSCEKTITSALREVEEEIGLQIKRSDLNFIGTHKELHHHKTDFIDNEIHYLYISKLHRKLEELTIQEEELTELKLIPISEFEKIMQDSDFTNNFVGHEFGYYNFIITAIKKELNL